MFGTKIAARYIRAHLGSLPEVQATVEDRISNTLIVPKGMGFPAIIFYSEASSYNGAWSRAADINEEHLRYVIRVICPGASTDPIEDAAIAQFEHFGVLIDNNLEFEGTHYQIVFEANGEVPLTNLVTQDGEIAYSQLGTVYDVTITRGG